MSPVAIFDLDGTLVDTPRAIVETFTAVFAAMGAPAVDALAIRATIGMPLERAFGQLLGVPPDHDQVASGIRHYQALFRELVLPRAEGLLFPGVAAGLGELRARGFTLAVATSKFQASAEALLTAARLRDQLDVVVGADRVTRPKPDPEMGVVIMRMLGVVATDAVVIGDTTHDLLMARAAGIRSIAVTYGVHGIAELQTAEPTWLADSFVAVVGCLRAAFGLREASGGHV